METTELINELRAEIAALSLRVEQLEKQMAETQLLDFDAETIEAAEEPKAVEPAPEAVLAAEAVPAEAVEPSVLEETAELAAEPAEPAADAPAAEAPEAVLVEEPAAEAPIWDLDISLEGTGVNPLPDLHSFQWMMDIPGGEVANLISGISLNDRVLFINTLFREDPKLFQKTVTQLNAMASLEDAVSFLVNHFPEWNLNSELVYRFMMAVRRKLK
ncbi:MAG: hypothetical protein KIG19_03960 [Bacteroidales bacterium]|nr:hypothetical protein [Bacteroidales bacterium]